MGGLIVNLVGAVMPVVAIVVSYVLSRRQRVKVASRAADQLNTIEVLVNGRMSAALARIAELEQALGIHPEAPAPHPEEVIVVKKQSQDANPNVTPDTR